MNLKDEVRECIRQFRNKECPVTDPMRSIVSAAALDYTRLVFDGTITDAIKNLCDMRKAWRMEE